MTRDGQGAGSRGRVAVVALGPVVLAVALLAHPFISGRLPNETAVAEEAAADTTMWGIIHLATAVGSALVAVAFLAVRGYLQEAGEIRRSGAGLPFVVVGSTLYAVLPGMEFVPLAVAGTGATTAQVAAAQSEITPWLMVVLLAGAVTFAAGAYLFAAAVTESKVAEPGLTRVVVIALLAMALARFIPLSVAQFYLQALSAVVAFWALAYVMRTRQAPLARPGATVGTA